MTELKENIEKLQEMILLVAQLYMSGKTAEATKQLPVVSRQLENILTNIMIEYQKKGIDQYQEEITYWSQQVGRIANAIESNDAFRIVDVLYFETRESLEQFKKAN